MGKQAANLTSNILNPFLVSLAVMLLLSFELASSTLDALKWSLILVAISILPVFSVIIYLVHSGRIAGLFVNAREQRTGIYWLVAACAGVGCLILTYLGAPLVLVATFVAGLSVIVVFMCINFKWKISVHTAFVAASVTVLIILYGFIAAVTVVLVPLVAWARVKVGHHSLAQVVIGAFLAALIVTMVFHLFNLGPSF